MIEFFDQHWRALLTVALMTAMAHVVIDARQAHRLRPTPSTRRALNWSIVAVAACSIHPFLGDVEMFAPFRRAHFGLYQLIVLPFDSLAIAAMIIIARSQFPRPAPSKPEQ